MRFQATSLSLLAATGYAQVAFVEVGAERGIGAYDQAFGMAAGIAAADYDSDGDVDLFVPTGRGSASLLYSNRGDGTFEDVALQVGIDTLDNDRGGLWFDSDSDGDLDLLVLGDSFQDLGSADPASLRLYEQDAGVFVDVTEAAGLYLDLTGGYFTHFGGAAAGDLTGDGHLDLVIGMWEGENWYFVNDGKGAFVEAGPASGMKAYGHFWQPVLHDFDGDGRQDVFQAVDFAANQLWLASGDGTFRDVAARAGVDTAFNEMGVALGDYDGDGDFDLYVTNVLSDSKHSVLFERRPEGLAFEEVSRRAGVWDGGWGWGTTFLDADLNGTLDLAATNGGVLFGWSPDRSLYFHNPGGDHPVFSEAGHQVGYDDWEEGSGLVAFDADRDGDLDLMQACSSGSLLYYLNVSRVDWRERRFLTVQPRMPGSNRFAIGAVVRVRAGTRTYSRVVSAGTSLASQEPAEAHFGFPATDAVDVRVEWPDGTVTERKGVASGQVLTITP